MGKKPKEPLLPPWGFRCNRCFLVVETPRIPDRCASCGCPEFELLTTPPRQSEQEGRP